MVYLDTAQATIRWDAAEKCAFIEWRSYADGEDYRNVSNTLLDVIVARSATKLLSDTRLMKVVTPEDQAWVGKEWVPRAEQAGLKWIAVLVPKSALGKMSLQRMAVKAGPLGGGATMHFEDLESARKWLRSVG